MGVCGDQERMEAEMQRSNEIKEQVSPITDRCRAEFLREVRALYEDWIKCGVRYEWCNDRGEAKSKVAGSDWSNACVTSLSSGDGSLWAGMCSGTRPEKRSRV